MQNLVLFLILCACTYEVPKIWGATHLRRGRGVADALTRYSPRFITPNFDALGQTVWASVGKSKKFWGRWGFTPSNGGG